MPADPVGLTGLIAATSACESKKSAGEAGTGVAAKEAGYKGEKGGRKGKKKQPVGITSKICPLTARGTKGKTECGTARYPGIERRRA
jgi:hypothetical protein